MPAAWRLFSAGFSGPNGFARMSAASAAAAAAAGASLLRSFRIKNRPPVVERPGDGEPQGRAAAWLASLVRGADWDDRGPWTAKRLKDTLRTCLHSERVIIVANREPCIHDRNAEGAVVAQHPASGLVTALEPVVRACSGVWVGHGSGSADRDAADAAGHVTIGTGDSSYLLRRIWLNEEEERGYYYGFANDALWPLCHVAHARPIFRRDDWEHYCRVNERFAEAVEAEADSDAPIVLVQDYHFALVPELLRRRLPRATILSFWHIPWPNPERLSICPYQDALLRGLLGSSIIGFQTPLYCRNFLESVDRSLEARIDHEENAVVHDGQTTLVRPYPISIEWPDRLQKTAPPVDECRRTVRAELGLAPNAPLIVSVDRLDYTKGFEERLAAIERLLEEMGQRPSTERLAILQIAAPSRVAIEQYRTYGDRIRAEVERINARFASNGFRPLMFLNRHHEPPEIVRYYRAADVCYVSSLHDGMNLVAKEFIAARDDECGVLVLSRFAGAARELTEALVVNPYDIEGVASALKQALAMSPEEQRTRIRPMRAFLAEHNLYRWAGHMLMDAARLRQRERLLGRLAVSWPSDASGPAPA